MTWGTDDMGRGLFLCITAALSADVPSVDAQPYRPTFKKSFEWKKFCRKKTKRQKQQRKAKKSQEEKKRTT